MASPHPSIIVDPRLDKLPARIRDRIRVHANGCWLWAGSRNCRDGYAQTRRPGGGTANAHRVIYELVHESAFRGLEIDHLCRVRHCVNPDHLEAVTKRENILRGEGLGAKNARKTHCKRGHALTGDNLYANRLKKGLGRQCRTCTIEYMRQRRQP